MRRILIGVAVLVIAGGAFLLLRGYVQDRRNDEGIAWAVPKGEHVDLAEAGVAVTEADEGRTLIGRDLETGKRRWSVEFSWPNGYHANEVHRVGKTLILVDRIGDVHGLDIATGRERWTQTPAGDAQPSVATPDVVAFSVCGGPHDATPRRARSRTGRWCGRRPSTPAIATWARRTSAIRPTAAAGCGPRATCCCARRAARRATRCAISPPAGWCCAAAARASRRRWSASCWYAPGSRGRRRPPTSPPVARRGGSRRAT